VYKITHTGNLPRNDIYISKPHLSFKMGRTRFDPNFTDAVINNIGPKCPEREREIISSLIRHIHDFAREVELTPEEWLTGVNFINSIGQISTPVRNEGHRICDVIGLES